MLSRPHPVHGWLYLAPPTWRETLDRSIRDRDAMNDVSHSGPAPAFLRWVAEEQMPALARNPRYRAQFGDRIVELELKRANLEQQITEGRQDLEPAAGMVRREMRWLQGLLEPAGVAP